MTMKSPARPSPALAPAEQRNGQSNASAARPRQRPARSALHHDASGLADDLLLGALAIASFLKWKRPSGQLDVQKVYHLASKGSMPIHNIPGLGLCARRSGLHKFFAKLDERVDIAPADATQKMP